MELSVVFSSDKDGELGAGTITSNGEISYTNNQLSNNDHIISMLVTDEVGASCGDTVIVFVGTEPIATIEEPLSGDVFSVGDNILFTETDLSRRINITSSRDSLNGYQKGEMFLL